MFTVAFLINIINTVAMVVRVIGEDLSQDPLLITLLSLHPKCPPGADKCPWNQVFDEFACACVCKSNLKGICRGKQYFNNPDKCLCECPAEATKACGRNQVLDPNTCECVWLKSVRCNWLQKFNEDTCDCECRKVIVPVAPRRRRPICIKDSSDSDSSDGGSDSDSSDSGCERSDLSSEGGKRHYGSRSKRSDSSGKHDSSDSSQGGRGGKKQRRRPIIASQCPRGLKTNHRTCRCFYRCH